MMLPETSSKPESPAASSHGYDSMIAAWAKIQTILDGTESMREAGQAYLPQHAEESNDAYHERLGRNTLFNMTSITLEAWVGRPFSDAMVFSDENKPPSQIEELADNIDLQGTDIGVFARSWFRDGLAKAISHVLIDFPRPRDTEAEEGRPRTLADDRQENLRPYWVHLRPEMVFFIDVVNVDGAEVIREVRFWETYSERVGYAEVVKPQIRRLFLAGAGEEGDGELVMHVETFRENPKKNAKEEEKWLLEDSYATSLTVIPLVTFYADRDGVHTGKPPVEDLADLNIAHWQSTSDQRAVITVARFPMLALSGGTDDDNQLRIGPHEWLYSPDPQGKFYYVEHSGKAIEAGRKDLEDLERQMSEYGAEFLKKRPGNLTATARALDSAEATSPLQDATVRFLDAMKQALDLTAAWMGLDDGGEVSLPTDFGPEEFSAQDMAQLSAARKQRDISLPTYLAELKRRGVLDEDLDVDEEIARLEEEALTMTGGLPGMEGDEDGTEEETDDEEDTDETETPPEG